MPEGYEEVIKKGLRVELNRAWITSPKKKGKKAKENAIDKSIALALKEAKSRKIVTNIGEREDIW